MDRVAQCSLNHEDSPNGSILPALESTLRRASYRLDLSQLRFTMILKASNLWWFLAWISSLCLLVVMVGTSRLFRHGWWARLDRETRMEEPDLNPWSDLPALGMLNQSISEPKPIAIPQPRSHPDLSTVSVRSRREAIRLSPPNGAVAESIQIDSETMVLVGGYTNAFSDTSRWIQFFNISSQQWYRKIQLPDEVAETHQGLAWDSSTRLFYIVSGQLGPGCMPATTTVVQFHVDGESFEYLPPLPSPRYSPGVALIRLSSSTQHLHVFGGASDNRKDSATDHWRLVINNEIVGAWESLEQLPDGGTHGASFVSTEGYIHYTGFCNMDTGVHSSPSMVECHRHAATKQRLHHVSHTGLTFRYPSALVTTNADSHWERVTDMPFPLCHGGFLSHNNKLFMIAGSSLTLQTARGSAPTSWPVVQVWDATQGQWSVASFRIPRKRMPLFLLSTWVDFDRDTLYSLHAGKTLISIPLGNSSSVTKNTAAATTELLLDYKAQTRRLAIAEFQACLQAGLNSSSPDFRVVTALDGDDYDDLRGTWNQRNSRKQYPHAIVQPTRTSQVAAVITCAKSTGYHVCARNGRHSYDGTTCTNGIVVDVSKFQSIEMLEGGVVRLGAGLTLGQMVVGLQNLGYALPAGSCSSVGLTGLVLNGGQGPLGRLHGMTSDHLVGLELVDARGQVIRAADENEYADLLFVARGGGSVGYHFPGIITHLEFGNLIGIPRNQTLWTRIRIRYTSATVDNAVALLQNWSRFYVLHKDDTYARHITAEPWLFLERRRRRGGYQPALRLVVYFFYPNGAQHEIFLTRYLPVFQEFALGAKITSIEHLTQLDFHVKLGGLRNTDQLSVPDLGHDVNTSWFGLSAVVSNQSVSDAAFSVLAKTIFLRKPYYRRYAEFKPLGGVIASEGATSAFPHRNASWWVLLNHFQESPEMGWETSIQENFDNVVIPALGSAFEGHYAGYVSHSNSTARDLQLYYRGNADRVRHIKRSRDPHGLFRNFMPNNDMKQ